MSAAVMMERIAAASPRFKARIAGALYLIIIAGGLFAEAFVRQRLIVHSDAAATCRPADTRMTAQTKTLKGFVWFTVNLENSDALAPYSGPRKGASE